MALIDKLTAIADAIRAKTGGTKTLTLDEMATEIEGISTGGGGTDEIDSLMSGDCTSISNSRITTLGIGCAGNTALTSVNLPNVTNIACYYAFYDCTALSSVTLPALQTTANYAFRGCKALKKVVLPKLTKAAAGAFMMCSGLTLVDLPVLTAFTGNQTLYNCSALTAVILRSGTMATLAYTNTFSGTPIASGTGYIYVPSALVDSYKAATNWSTYAAQIRALEDYTVDGTITGELDSTKI